MNILVIGSGGREHALCWAFAQSKRVGKIFCAPGNAGIAEVAECIPIKPEEIERLAGLALEKEIGLTFVGGETALALGIVDAFESRGLKIIGASKKAAQLEASKAFAKDFMKRCGVPTAEYALANSSARAVSILESGVFGGPGAPVVVKADGLAAGKGVVVAADRAEAVAAIKDLGSVAGSEAASKIVLEECLTGREVSLLMFADGEDFVLMTPTRDHKRIGEGDTGPNTGGMGTFTDSSLLSEDQLAEITETIIRPTLRGCIAEGFPFRGILFLGLMMEDNSDPMQKPARQQGLSTNVDHHALTDVRASAGRSKLLEYNVRFGDPETQSILVRLETDLVEICEAMLEGKLNETDIHWRPGSSATVVLAADGYPQSPRKGDVISGLETAAAVPGVTIFHAGTSRNAEGELVTSGGRVLGITAAAESLDGALRQAYKGVDVISWNGMQYRRDIGRPIPSTAGSA
ncbi:MAG: phosphoribosylamine--glycine ligase [Acidobacteria bacterium]|nr:phosphoribosylamine--glycine ligase [Acidobacteriota bacterium]